VGPSVPVLILPDTSPVPGEDAKEAYGYMTSLTPIPFEESGSGADTSAGNTWKQRTNNVAWKNHFNKFQFSVPYTKEGKAHAKTIDMQWKRTTVLTVRSPFPYLASRQLVISREVRDLSPIEVATDDIEDIIGKMAIELKKAPSKLQSDVSTLMMRVQGAVAPQVILFPHTASHTRIVSLFWC
jgi:hypothetical protein